MTGAAARASCATSSCARAGAPARSRCGWSPASGELDRECARSAPAPALDGLLWTRVDSVAETTHGGETELLAGV